MPKRKELQYQVDKNNCHVCISHVSNGDGYPYIYHNGKYWRISRLVYSQQVSNIPKKMVLMHKCDNRLCINPDHLQLGTIAKNNQDRAEKGRNRDQSGEKNNMVKLSKSTVIDIYKSTKSRKELAVDYNVCRQTIDNIKNKTRWKDRIEKEVELYEEQNEQL